MYSSTSTETLTFFSLAVRIQYENAEAKAKASHSKYFVEKKLFGTGASFSESGFREGDIVFISATDAPNRPDFLFFLAIENTPLCFQYSQNYWD
jgi:hypothetical protein